MKTEYVPPTEIGKQRSAWFREHAKTGMTMDDFLLLNEEAHRLFPRTAEERKRKTESLMAMPEFVL